MVSTPDLAVAKAALTATLLRADPDSLHQGDVARFLELLDDTLDRCSRTNVKVRPPPWSPKRPVN